MLQKLVGIVFTMYMIRISKASLAKTKETKIKTLIWSGFAILVLLKIIKRELTESWGPTQFQPLRPFSLEPYWAAQ